jgi:hypothetical protein
VDFIDLYHDLTHIDVVGSPPITVQPNLVYPSVAQLSDEQPNIFHSNDAQPNIIQPNVTQNVMASSEAITLTVTLPAAIVASRQQFNITVTLTSQWIARAHQNTGNTESVTSPMSTRTPHVRVPRLNFAGVKRMANMHNLNTVVGDDPFADGGIHDGVDRGGTAACVTNSHADSVPDTPSVAKMENIDNEEDLGPEPIYSFYPGFQAITCLCQDLV